MNMRRSTRIAAAVALLALFVAPIAFISLRAQVPPPVPSGGTITGYLTGTLSGTTLTVNAPVPGISATLSNSQLPNPVLTGTTASIGGGSVSAGACASGTATIAGAATTMVPVATASTSGAPGAGFAVYTQVTSGNTVTVSVCAIVTGTPTASTYLVRVIT